MGAGPRVGDLPCSYPIRGSSHIPVPTSAVIMRNADAPSYREDCYRLYVRAWGWGCFNTHSVQYAELDSRLRVSRSAVKHRLGRGGGWRGILRFAEVDRLSN